MGENKGETVKREDVEKVMKLVYEIRLKLREVDKLLGKVNATVYMKGSDKR